MKALVGDDLERYIELSTRARPPLYDELRKVTYEKMSSPGMQVGRVEGTFLKTLARISGARRAVEIGTFTGYSALCIAEGMADDGELWTCDMDPEALSIARSFFARAPQGKKIHVAEGDARESLAKLDGPFDLAFLDGDKKQYVDYYEALVPKMRKGGLIVADNTLWSGKVLDPQTSDDHGIVAFNARVTADPRVENVLLAVRDGVMLAVVV